MEKKQPTKLDPKQLNAVQWFRKTLSDIRKLKKGTPKNYEDILKDSTKNIKRRLLGQVIVFRYLPRQKVKFFDRFPIVIVTHIDGKKITGLNLHYVPPIDRIKLILLMNSLLFNAKETDLQKTRVKILSLLNKKIFAKYKNTITKTYLAENIIGKAKLTTPQEWSYLAFLPVFKGASPSQVYSEVLKVVNKKQ